MKQLPKITISVGLSAPLVDAVQTVLLKAGYDADVLNMRIGHVMRMIFRGEPAEFRMSPGSLDASGHADEGWYARNPVVEGHRHFNAATEIGALIAYVHNAPRVIQNVIKDTSGITTSGVISDDGKTVKVGCSTATFEKVKEVYNAMKEAQK